MIIETHKSDTQDQIFFYEQDFYCLSNFSSFTLQWKGLRFDTSEATYHWEKFLTYESASISELEVIRKKISLAPSAHEAFQLSRKYKELVRPDWDNVKIDIMKEILWAKVKQHEYVRQKLVSSGNRQLIEDSWRDDFWGWGPNKDGKNILGELWMMIRGELDNQNYIT